MTTTKSDSSTILKFAVGLIVLLLIGSLIIRWLGSIIVLIVWYLNRDLVLFLFQKVKHLYQQNLLYGIGATVLSIVLLSPFTVFLFVRTIAKAFFGKTILPIKKKQHSTSNKTIIDITPTEQSSHYRPQTEGLLSIEEIRAKLREDD